MTKPDRTPADLKIAEPPRAERAVERMPSAEGEISALASANAPLIWFDEVTYCGFGNGIGALTLTAARQIAHVTNGDGSARVLEDKVITCLLRAPLPVLSALKDTIISMEKAAAEKLAAIAAAAQEDTPRGLPN